MHESEKPPCFQSKILSAVHDKTDVIYGGETARLYHLNPKASFKRLIWKLNIVNVSIYLYSRKMRVSDIKLFSVKVSYPSGTMLIKHFDSFLRGRNCHPPIGLSTVLEPENPLIDFCKLHQIHRSPDHEALKLIFSYSAPGWRFRN